MVDGKMLTEKTKEELIKIILDQDARIRELEETIKAEKKKRTEKFAKPNTANKHKKRPGQKLGHAGMTRATPDHIDEVVEETLCECPECRHALGNPVDEERLFNFMAAGYADMNLQRLSKRFAQSWLDIFRFLKDPTLAWNNNLAERMIRPNVIYRNRSFGNRSERGAEAHGTLMSLMQTLRLQGKNVGESLRLAFLQHRQGHAVPCLSLGAR